MTPAFVLLLNITFAIQDVCVSVCILAVRSFIYQWILGESTFPKVGHVPLLLWFQLKVGEPLFGFIYGEIIVIFTRVMAIENISDPRKPKLWGFEDTVSKCVLLFHVHV